jgi:hypothetical protein
MQALALQFLKNLKLSCAGALPFFLMSCVSSPQQSPTVSKVVKDVPQIARAEEMAPKKRVMVLPFLDENDNRPGEWKVAAEKKFIDELNKQGEVMAIGSDDLKLNPERYLTGGQYDFSELAKEGKDLGIAAFLEGKIIDIKVKRKTDPVGVFRQMKTNFEAQVRMRVASARNGKELFNTLKTMTIEEANVRVSENVQADRFLAANPEILKNLVTESFLDFQPQILEALNKMVWEGRIAGFSGDRIFLNVGRVSGLQIGDVLKVAEEGDEVFDPQSGNFIGKVPGRMKGTVEVISYFGQDGAVAVIHSGAGFKENDRVEIY